MMKFECKDVGMDCDFVATAATREEVMEMALAHAGEAHGDMLKYLTDEQTADMNAKLESVITDEGEESEEMAGGLEGDVAGDDKMDEELEGDEDQADEEGEEETAEA